MHADPMDEAIGVRLAPATRAELDALARATARDREDLVRDAVAAYLDLNQHHTARIQEGLRQAKDGKFATDEEVASAFAVFG